LGLKPISMDWFNRKITGKPHIEWENLGFPLNQSIDNTILWRYHGEKIWRYTMGIIYIYIGNI
jgi:hypothetical protein